MRRQGGGVEGDRVYYSSKDVPIRIKEDTAAILAAPGVIAAAKAAVCAASNLREFVVVVLLTWRCQA